MDFIYQDQVATAEENGRFFEKMTSRDTPVK